jgi:hypothetical protein
MRSPFSAMRRLSSKFAPLSFRIFERRDWRVAVPSSESTSFADVLGDEALKIAFIRPIYLAHSAWLEHIPFAFWLIHQLRPRVFVELGTHYGCSYFAFCQAVERLSLNTRCYAVDTWKGDEHAGFYGEDVYRTVNVHNNARYSQFSRLVRASFEDSAQYFEDGSIDLLHIDGLHTFDAVHGDFETWKPKLSERAVLVLHDTNVRERGFGVSCFLKRLRSDYPVFEFPHGHGLGVVGVGMAQDDRLQSLYEADGQDRARHDLIEFFARLGRACADAHLVTTLQAQLGSTRVSEPVAPAVEPQ